MRPKSIVIFERLMLVALAIGAAISVALWERSVRQVAGLGFGSGFVAIVQIATFAILLALVLLISRKASVAAKWIFIVLFALGLLYSLPGLTAALRAGLIGVAQVAQLLLQLAAIYFLFRPDARGWFSERNAPAAPPAP